MHALPGGHTIASWWFLFILFINLPCWLPLILLDEAALLVPGDSHFFYGGSLTLACEAALHLPIGGPLLVARRSCHASLHGSHSILLFMEVHITWQ